MMELISYEILRDGTLCIETSEGNYSYDFRMESETKGYLYQGFGDFENSNILLNSKELEQDIIQLLRTSEDILIERKINQIFEIRNGLADRDIISMCDETYKNLKLIKSIKKSFLKKLNDEELESLHELLNFFDNNKFTNLLINLTIEMDKRYG